MELVVCVIFCVKTGLCYELGYVGSLLICCHCMILLILLRSPARSLVFIILGEVFGYVPDLLSPCD